MASEPDAPVHPYHASQSGDKEAEIERFYELLSAGRSVGEILSGADTARSKSEQGCTVAAEQPQSAPVGAATARAPEVAVAGAAQANALCIGGLNLVRVVEAEDRRTGEPREAGSSSRDVPESADGERFLREGSPASGPDTVGPASAPAFGDRDAGLDSADRKRLFPVKVPGIVTSIMFWALYTGAIASVSIAGFSILRGGHRTEPAVTRVHADMSSGAEALTLPAPTPNGSRTVARAAEPNVPEMSADVLPAPRPRRPGRADAPVAEPLQPIPVGAHESVPAARLGAEVPQQPNTGQPDAREQSAHPAEASRSPDDLLTPLGAQPSSATPSASAQAAPLADTGQPGKDAPPQAIPEDETKAAATVPTGKASAALNSHAPTAGRHGAGTTRRYAEARRYVRRRTPVTYPQPAYYGQRSASHFADPAERYGYGIYGPAPYSDTGN